MVMGLNVTLIVQLVLAASVLPQVPLCPKLEVATMLEIVRVAVPVLLRVTA